MPFLRYWLQIAEAVPGHDIEEHPLIGVLRFRLIAIANFVTALPPPWTYQISGSRVRLPTRTMRL